MKQARLILPHQLFEQSPLFEVEGPIFLVEEHLFFNQYAFHKQKIAFHRATMKHYESYLLSKNCEVHYIEAKTNVADIRQLVPKMADEGIEQLYYIDPVDDWLGKRLEKTCKARNITTTIYDSPSFLNTTNELDFFKPKKKYHQTSFYIEQRKKRNMLLESDGTAAGGKWSFDAENRKKYPAKKVPPSIQFPDSDNLYKEAQQYVKDNFPDNLGILTEHPRYPTNFESTKVWLRQFLENRFAEFGTYEDAIVAENSILHHSVLTPMLNVGLITPKEVIAASLDFANKHNIPLNSAEGFIRQIIGWREFIRGIYIAVGSKERSCNFWNFKRKIPASFYDGTTGIYPIDKTIHKVLQSGYCHHIERLMVLGNFMLLCEFDPDEVYRWFMELFIDAYDWVMVPNVYGMSQFADGGLMATKPYISGSNYLMKMSDYKKGEWQATWDGLFWNFMDKHRDFFLSNPRLGMLVRLFDKMPVEKKETHLKNAATYLQHLDVTSS